MGTAAPSPSCCSGSGPRIKRFCDEWLQCLRSGTRRHRGDGRRGRGGGVGRRSGCLTESFPRSQCHRAHAHVGGSGWSPRRGAEAPGRARQRRDRHFWPRSSACRCLMSCALFRWPLSVTPVTAAQGHPDDCSPRLASLPALGVRIRRHVRGHRWASWRLPHGVAVCIRSRTLWTGMGQAGGVGAARGQRKPPLDLDLSGSRAATGPAPAAHGTRRRAGVTATWKRPSRWLPAEVLSLFYEAHGPDRARHMGCRLRPASPLVPHVGG